MAFRIHDSVARGEIDNRGKGMVRGKIWLAGRAAPVVLELKGNAWPDLAGCLLTFTNPRPPVAHPRLDSLHGRQRGSIGDLTASRKVRVFDIPPDGALAMMRRKEKPPRHLANSLYLEWFSEANGRVVIESADYDLAISTPEWRMTPAEEAERANQAAAGLVDFMKRLTDAVETHRRQQKDPAQPWDEHDYEKFLKECDARTDQYGALLDKYGDAGDSQTRIAQEMGWNRPEDEDGDERMSAGEMNALREEAASPPPPGPEPLTEGIDWIRTGEGDLRHPLQNRCFESAVKYWRLVRKLGLDPSTDKDLGLFILEFQTTGAKLAGALNGIAREADPMEPAFTVACLKRALGHLHKAQAGLEAVAPKPLLPPRMIAEARQELFEIREGILRLMDRFRGR